MVQYSTDIQAAKLDAIETTVGTAPIMRIYSGTIPASCAAALSGNTLLAQGTLPSDWMGNASSNTKAKAGTWTLTGQSGAAGGTAATWYAIFNSADTARKIQGPISELGLDNTSIANGQVVTINTLTITGANT